VTLLRSQYRDELKGAMNNAPFFIVGSGRSGTTLLRVMLASHPRITIPPETWFLVPLTQQLPCSSPLDRQQVQRAIQIMTRHYRWPDMGMSEDELREQINRLTSPTLTNVVEVLYAKYLREEHAQRWGDKTPPYITILPELQMLFPEAQFIHMIRDGRDVTKSLWEQRWHGRWLHCGTVEWNGAIKAAHEYEGTPIGSRIMTLHYEALVSHPQQSLQRVCDFLGEVYDPNMLKWADTLDSRIPEREKAVQTKLAKVPQLEDIERWKREMTARQVFVVEAFTAQALIQSGYVPRFRSILWRPLFALARWWCTVVLPAVDFAERVYRFTLKRARILSQTLFGIRIGRDAV
jgi:hypothetical protein